jgi:hypothetical protein
MKESSTPKPVSNRRYFIAGIFTQIISGGAVAPDRIVYDAPSNS